MIFDLVLSLAILSGFLQFVGYCYYINKTLKTDIDPNPTTWLIFSFDTSILVLLEFFAGADFKILILPITCALLATFVAFLIYKNGKLSWPEDKIDSYVLVTGIIVTVVYTLLFTLQHSGLISSLLFIAVGYLFILLSNLNTFVAFVPIIKDTAKDPYSEHAGPWLTWTLAYTTLLFVTYLEVGLEKTGLIFYLYPISCILLHGIMAILASDFRKKKIQSYV